MLTIQGYIKICVLSPPRSSSVCLMFACGKPDQVVDIPITFFVSPSHYVSRQTEGLTLTY